MKGTLRVLNELEQAGYIRRYAIGGAVATLFYPIEPSETIDLDILVLLPADKHAKACLMPLGDVYAELDHRGYGWEDEYRLIEGVPVQFLVADPPLLAEAVEEAVEMPYDEEISTRVPTAEHLVAIMLDTGRAKDRGRFVQMLKDVPLDRARLDRILKTYALNEKFASWNTE